MPCYERTCHRCGRVFMIMPSGGTPDSERCECGMTIASRGELACVVALPCLVSTTDGLARALRPIRTPSELESLQH